LRGIFNLEKAFQPTRKTALQAKNWSAETMTYHDLLVFSSLAVTSVADGHSLSPAATAGKKTCIFLKMMPPVRKSV
jgi:hypothetical protein